MEFVIELIVSCALFINALLFIPQALKIVREKSVGGVSLITFCGFLLIQIAVVLHGIINKDYILIVGYLLSIATCSVVVALIIIYTKKNKDKLPTDSPLIDAFQQKLELLQNIIALMPGHVYWIDRKGVYMGCNDQQAISAGLSSRKDIVGKRNKDLPWNAKAGSLAEDLDQANQNVMNTGKSLEIEEPGLLNGNEAVFLSHKVPLKDAHNEVIGMVGISIDITDRKKMESSLLEAKEVAEYANNLKTEFIRNMEHDIRTPFCGIFGLAALLEENESDPEKKNLLGAIASSAKELLEYNNNILTFSQIEANALADVVKKFDLHALIERITTMESPSAIAKNIGLSVDYPQDLHKIVIGDEKRLERILLNLTSNAIKFTQQGYVKIKVRLAKKVSDEEEIFYIMVEDTGIGITEENQEHMYEKFMRGSPSNKGLYKGSGLGLHIVKQLIDEIKGEIDVKSKIGEGSLFICTIPFKVPLIDAIP